MKTQFKNPINKLSPLFLVLMSMFILGFGCNTPDTPKPTPDPLAGYQGDFKEQPNQAIVKDYQDYIQKNFSPEQRKYTSVKDWLKDGTGQHAIVIEVDLNGTTWNHVLIYDKDDKRIKAYKYVYGHYRS